MTKATSRTKKGPTGGCLCGNIRFEIRGTPAKPHTCSCRMCRRHTGALTVAWVEFGKADVAWTGPGGPPAKFRSSEQSNRAFCSTCGSSIGAIDEAPTVALLVGAFDDPAAVELISTAHAFASAAPSWWHVETGGTALRKKTRSLASS